MLVVTERQGMATASRKPIQGIGLNYLIGFLECVRIEKRPGELHRESPYRFKKSTINIIRWCLDKQLITRREEFKSTFKSARPQIYYKISDKGLILLGLVQ